MTFIDAPPRVVLWIFIASLLAAAAVGFLAHFVDVNERVLVGSPPPPPGFVSFDGLFITPLQNNYYYKDTIR